MTIGQRPSRAIRFFVPGYLFVFGAGLLAGAVLVSIYLPDEPFVTILAGLGGLTMWGTVLAMLTVARNR